MEQDLVVRGRAARTREAYLHAVAELARYYRRPPDQLTDREVQQYLLYLIQERKLAWSSCRQAVCALRFFYEITLGRPRATFRVPLPKGAQKLPDILSREEVARLLAATTTLKHRVLLMTTYAGGLRVSEVVRLRYCEYIHREVVAVTELLGAVALVEQFDVCRSGQDLDDILATIDIIRLRHILIKREDQLAIRFFIQRLRRRKRRDWALLLDLRLQAVGCLLDERKLRVFDDVLAHAGNSRENLPISIMWQVLA